MAQYSVSGGLMDEIIKVRLPKKESNFLTSLVTVSLSTNPASQLQIYTLKVVSF
jgi:hypothetical protein